MLHHGKEYRLFFRQFRHQFHTTGAILPSSRALGRALARFVGRGPEPERILEVGPGTGAVTRSIIEAMRPADQFDLVEINLEFVRYLRHWFATKPSFQKVADRTVVHHGNITEFRCDKPYDVIVSGLPLNNFSEADVRNILAAFCRVARPGATLSFFQYMAVRQTRLLISGQRQRARLRGVGAALDELLEDQEIHRDWVWTNVPPAWVHHVRMAGSRSTDEALVICPA
ncbi:MAG: hypothetical protein A2W31_12550 [Planctomycetes bacterium RBG_16_64_10]|nr:MAG: hypothetical protein A2W31_12550 [Planctomycetes bacterium RBG_16_64_10]